MTSTRARAAGGNCHQIDDEMRTGQGLGLGREASLQTFLRALQDMKADLVANASAERQLRHPQILPGALQPALRVLPRTHRQHLGFAKNLLLHELPADQGADLLRRTDQELGAEPRPDQPREVQSPVDERLVGFLDDDQIEVAPLAGLPGGDRTQDDRVGLAIELEDLFGVPRVDLVVLPQASPYLAVDIVSGELLFCADAGREAEYELFVLRRAGDLAFFERERRRMILAGIAP